jgi:hypothetical protein
MTNIYQKLAVATAGAAMSFAAMESNPAQAALLINSESVVANLDSREALFTIEFNEVPDFFTVDSVGRQADSFQYYIDTDGELPVFRGSPYFSELETIIRADEINVAGDIRIRNVFPIGSGGANSGGWGPLRGSVPYTLNGTVLTFLAPLELIGDSDGLFSYRLETYEFGGTSGIPIESTSVIQSSPPRSVPEPNSTIGLLALGMLGAASTLKRKQKQ